jgi:glycosyltransferase involved in cell wall biosynthesis
MAFFSRRCVERIHRTFKATVIDAHFLYPDGWAASRIARKLGLPLTITIRGSKDEWLIGTDRERFLVEAMQAATHLFAVSDALKRDVAVRLGVSEDKVSVVGNGVDLGKFHPVDKREARRRLGLDEHAKVLIGVGGLVPRKGFQRVIPLLAALRQRYPDLVYLIVGGETGDARMRVNLEALARRHGVEGMIRFCGAQPPAALKWFYGAADVFALATEHEGWANVFLEAMACGLPVVTTRVGGNAQVVADSTVGTIVDWWDAEAFRIALDAALSHDWDRDAIVSYARSNTWDNRVARLVEAFNRVVSQSGAAAP